VRQAPAGRSGKEGRPALQGAREAGRDASRQQPGVPEPTLGRTSVLPAQCALSRQPQARQGPLLPGSGTLWGLLRRTDPPGLEEGIAGYVFCVVNPAWGERKVAAGVSRISQLSWLIWLGGCVWRGGKYRCLCPLLVQEFLFVFLGKSSLEPPTGSHLERMQPAVQPGDVSAGVFGKQRGLGREADPRRLKTSPCRRLPLPSRPGRTGRYWSLRSRVRVVREPWRGAS
jgi:hypothetical protein